MAQTGPTSGVGQPGKLMPTASKYKPPVKSGHLPIALGAKRKGKGAVKPLSVKRGK